MVRLVTIMLVAVIVFGAVAVNIASAQQVPNVSNLEPFSAQTNFMSLPGYLRWLIFQQTGNWITMQEAQRIVKQQAGQ